VSFLRQGSYLIASIDTALDDSQMIRFQSDLIGLIERHRSRGVIIDVAALDVLDSFGARTLREIAELAGLQGAVTVIVGIQPEVACAMSKLGIDTGAVHTAVDLEEGLVYLSTQGSQSVGFNAPTGVSGVLVSNSSVSSRHFTIGESTTPEQLARRVRWQLFLTIVSLVLTLLAAVAPVWIEATTSLEPDGGGGDLEWLLAVAFGGASVVFGTLCFRSRHKLSALRAT
jgi:rsbT antagonist protein RsbS